MSEQDDLWLKPGDWRSYESYVAGILSRRFVGTKVTCDVRIKGRKSGIARQIDILVETARPLVIDCKCYGRKVDVKHVEAFLGMLDDLGVRTGILITTKGYTSGALARAEGEPGIDLQILPPDRLSDYQRLGAPLIWRGAFGIWLEPPSGWIADDELTQRDGGALVAMYPLGHTLESARRLAAFSYANILSKPFAEATLDEIAAPHQANTLADEPDSTFDFEHLELVCRDGSSREALLRTAAIGAKPFGREHCLYVDYGEAVLLLVLLSLPSEAEVMVPKLLDMARTAFKMTVLDTAAVPTASETASPEG